MKNISLVLLLVLLLLLLLLLLQARVAEVFLNQSSPTAPILASQPPHLKVLLIEILTPKKKLCLDPELRKYPIKHFYPPPPVPSTILHLHILLFQQLKLFQLPKFRTLL